MGGGGKGRRRAGAWSGIWSFADDRLSRQTTQWARAHAHAHQQYLTPFDQALQVVTATLLHCELFAAIRAVSTQGFGWWG